MAHLHLQPPGVMVLPEITRKPIIKVISGDSWQVSLNLYSATDRSVPATPDNSIVQVMLAETQFDKPIWIGSWYCGVKQDPVRKDLHYIQVPNDVTKHLRRGSYQFSVRISDLLKTTFMTEAEGSFLVEYKPTSDIHSIPYKDDTSADDATTASSGNKKQETVVQANNEYFKSYVVGDVQHYVKQTMVYDPQIGWGAEWSGDYVIIDGKYVEVNS